MNRLSVRLIVSHVAVALMGTLVTLLVVRLLAPTIFDREMMRGGQGHGMGQGGGPGSGSGAGIALRQQFAAAVDQALLVGALVGIVVATALGIFVAYRLVRPLRDLRAATREMARGRYDVPVTVPRINEFADLADDVNSLGRQLTQTEARRVRLLGELAHEMRTPLTVIDGYVEGMIDGVLPTTAVELGQVGEESRRLRRLSDDLSALSRAEEGRIDISLREVDLTDVTRAATERVRAQFDDADVRLVVDVPDPIPIDADPDRIAQVITNLLGNALRATPPGGSVGVRTHRDGDLAFVEVADTGEGIAPEDLERVFERFYRVPGRRGDAHDSGSGIGLTIARGIARAHAGDLTVASPGRDSGSTFTLRLPAGRHPVRT